MRSQSEFNRHRAEITAYLSAEARRHPYGLAGLIKATKLDHIAYQIAMQHPPPLQAYELQTILRGMMEDFPWAFWEPEQKRRRIKPPLNFFEYD